MERRRFIVKAGRGIVLAGLMGLGTAMLIRDDENDSCEYDFICKNCKKRSSCELPEAEKNETQNNY